ncbi:CidA/LrgA family protein [Alkalihalobacterium chitinilyticum]|uniref:CidA/LrgA family holin-like protein n=1 Tax=Alkalihalobacterium chitinilyticum TaxID=2980103 RepID=A0ABT5VK89_9BACI|nr:CidA/LrgA family holin-like protein [Alkalihalobacterium chitinilyticum]MDE5415851.1 CidA/LrgA family holin-like protein [Alkalihalobacterium chitinilyticum]
MTILRIIMHIAILYLFYWVGAWIQQTFDLFIPGSIIGMLLLFVLFATKVIKPKWIEYGTSLLLRHMPLLFLPVTVGVLNFLDVFSGKGFLLVIIALISTIIVMVCSGALSQLLATRKEQKL